MISIKTPREIEIMAQGGSFLGSILQAAKIEVKPGVTTKALDAMVEKMIFEVGGQPSFKLPVAHGGGGFPATSCISVNEEVVHGVPSEKQLKEGDLVTLDIGMVYKGFHTDTAITVPVGEIDPEMRRMMKVAKKALKYAIKKSRQGNTIGDLGNTIERYVESQGFHVIYDLCGHGIGKTLHEDPQILNYGKRHKGPVIKEGMVFCPEPMITAGNPDIVLAKNGLTYVVKDGSWAAHFEHTVAIINGKAVALTQAKEEEEEKDDAPDEPME
jgi:methionyl aminopeptidase